MNCERLFETNKSSLMVNSYCINIVQIINTLYLLIDKTEKTTSSMWTDIM